ncbi:Hypothetical predicted protein [Cloeon dipterum]|uniref:Bromo domain-containing protein n=1 Tax=Cloeon dipterum TaxID=197152 RepID=A0A8S1CV00_9INSE|nr:Hypothetical predicted protein [Cloeon dipterum]
MDRKSSTELSGTSKELHFLVAKFLSKGPFAEIGKALKEQLEAKKVLPKRIDWKGDSHHQSFAELETKNSQVDDEHLLLLCQRFWSQRRPKDNCPIKGRGQHSILQPLSVGHGLHSTYLHLSNPANFPRIDIRNPVCLLFGRENSSRLLQSSIQNACLYSRMQLNHRTLGHLSAVFCVLFDKSGRFIITGADDLLVKIWEVHSGRLMATLRGASQEITDIDINPENTMLAAGSVDRIVRVWCLQTTAPIAVLCAHSGTITSVRWCPYPETRDFRYLVTTSADGSVAFWTYTHSRLGKDVVFNPKPIHHGGVFLAAASADHHVRIYNMVGDEGPVGIMETKVHTDRVDSIQWASKSLRFVSGAKDGTAVVWWYEAAMWQHRVLDMQKRLHEPTEEEAKIKLRVSMVAWAFNDLYVVTASNDLILRVWEAATGNLVHCLKSHTEELFVLERHPICQNLMLSAGHDGQINIWDVTKGEKIKSFQNLIDGQGYGAVYDAKWSPDGNMIAATDSHGHLLVFSLSENEQYKKLPKDMFFHTDYRPLTRDANHWVLDEQTQIAPHLMPSPFLVDIDGNPYPPEMQRLVPGRCKLKDEQLVPNLVVNDDGDEEVAPAQPIARSNIDEMIEQLARQNDQNEEPTVDEPVDEPMQIVDPAVNDHAYARSPPVEPSPNRSGANAPARRNADMEGVRQSGGNWQQNVECCIWLKKDLVRQISHLEEERIMKQYCALGEEEIKLFDHESKKQPVTVETEPPQVPKTKATKKIAKRNRANENNHNYRTRTSVLGGDFVDSRDLPGTSSSSSSDSSMDSDSDIMSNDSDSSDYSDWVAETNSDRQATLQPPKRSRRSTVMMRRSSQEKEDDDDSLDEDDQHDIDSQPGTSGVKRDSRLRQAPKKTVRHEDDVSPPRTVRNPATAKLLASNIKEVPEQFKPSEWLNETMPRKTPYFPQIGDEVVYFRQGHQMYLNAVRAKKIYDPGARCEPWLKMTLREVEFVKVVGIKYEIKPPRLCCLRLAIMNADTGAFASYFNIKYHDIPDVIDFLVLRQYYETAMEKNWMVGEQFRSLIDDSWWIGKITAHNPADLDFPDSPFQCFKVVWDNGEGERMSPWDIEAVDPNRLPADKGGSVSVLPQEIEASLFKSVDPQLWLPSGERDLECQRLLEAFDEIMGLSVAEPFCAPVDLSLYPSYALVIAYPIDLSMIRARLENRFYRSVQALQFDVRYIASNAEIFNQRKSQIVKQANILTDLCLQVIQNSSISVVDEYHILTGTYKSESSDGEVTGAKELSRKSPRKKSQPVMEADPDEWKEKCSDLLHIVMNSKDAGPFKEPVDVTEFSDYLDIVQNPMDLSTVRDSLENGDYNDPVEFGKNMRLIFTNSKNYNTNRKSMVYSMTVRLSNLFESSFHSILAEWRAQQKKSAKVTNGISAITTRSTAKKSSSGGSTASSVSSFTRGRKRMAITNGVSRRLRISSDSEESVASSSRNSVNLAVSSDHSTSTSALTALTNNGTSSKAGPSRQPSRQKQNKNKKCSSSEDEDDVDEGGSSPSGSRPESANFAEIGYDSSDESENSSEDQSESSEDDDDDDEEYGSRKKSKRPQRAAAAKKRVRSRNSDSDSSTEKRKRPKRAVPAPKQSDRNRRQQKVVSYHEASEEEIKPRKSRRVVKRNCIESDSGGEEEDEAPAVSRSSESRTGATMGAAITKGVDPPQDAGYSGTLKARPTTLLPRSQLTGTIRTGTLRASTRGEKMQQPMPRDVSEIEKRFTKVLNSMDLPVDKAKLLKQYDVEKKWDMICDQELVHAKDPPSRYLDKLRTYLDPRASRSARKRRMVLDSTSTQVLRDLEISLRTNHIEWVKEFLNEENKGLDVLVDYLSFRLMMLRREQKGTDSTDSSPNGSFLGVTNHNRPPLSLTVPNSPVVKRQSRHVAKLNMGESMSDIHVCIMCLRAIMNNKYGFNLVIQHSEAINCIALSLIHKTLRTKALVLELLAAICLVKGGHEIILNAFNSFKTVLNEKTRFQTLMHYFMNESFQIDFLVACMQFVNIIVHSVEDMNFRVHLQYEFTSLGLDQYLENLRHTESEELRVQILAYLDNVFDVHALMEDSELKTVALERVTDLEEKLGHAYDRLEEAEKESLYKIGELETALAEMRAERDDLLNKWQSADHEVSTLRKRFNTHESESLKRQSLLESKIKELQSNSTSSSCSSLSSPSHSSNSLPVPAPPPPPPAPPAPQCKPPPPPPMAGPPMPPPPPGFMTAPDGAMTIKRKVETKHKLPMLNWVAMKPNQVRGTVFNELDDDKLFKIINFQEFEEHFKIGNNTLTYAKNSEVDGLSTFPSKRFKKPETISLLEHTRLRNLAISRRKVGMTIDKVVAALNSLDLKQLSLENVEIIQKMLPTDQENKLYKEYIIERKSIDLLSDEDKFLMQLGKIERVATKLSIMSYMGNFVDTLHINQPQILAVITSSKSVRNSGKFRQLLEVILAFGNYLNSSKRGPAYGFKLQSLDTLLDTKSSDRRMSLLNYIVLTVKQYFPDLMNFDSELLYIEKASAVSLENVIHDVQELERGMENARKELELRSSFKEEVVVLKDFLINSEDKMKKLLCEAKNAQESFKDCLEYFGETPRQMDANTFFQIIKNFVKSFKVSSSQ